MKSLLALFLAWPAAAQNMAAFRVQVEPIALPAPLVGGAVASAMSVSLDVPLSAPSLGSVIPLSSIAPIARPITTSWSVATTYPSASAAPAVGQLAILRETVAELREPAGKGDISSLLETRWDGAGRRSSVSAPSVPVVIPVVTARTAAERAVLDAALAAARRSETGRSILDRVDELVGARREPISVRFAQLGGNLAELDYLTGRIAVAESAKAQDPRGLGVTLVHELLHVLQHADGVPSEALEMELEAHVLSLRMMRELGLDASSGGSFSVSALAALRESPDAFIAFIRKQLSEKFALIGSDLAQVRADLRDEIDELETAETDPRMSERKRARLVWARRDLRRLSTVAGQRRYTAYASRVRKLVEEEHAALAAARN